MLFLLSLAIAVSVGITMRLNYLFVISMVADAEKKVLVGWGTVIADLWKACGLIFVALLWRWRQYARAIGAALVWALCFVWAVASLLGSVAQERMATTGSRDTIHMSYADVEKELAEVGAQRKSLRSVRSSTELDALIAAALSRTVIIGVRVRTVDDISKNCTKPDRATADACNEIGDLRAELAVAVEAARLDVRIAELRKRGADLREKGATLSSDVQSEIIERFTRGLLSGKDAAMGLPLLVTAVFEAIGALCPAILFAVAEGTLGATGRVQTRTDASPATHEVPSGLVVDFLDDCTEPSDDGRALAISHLYAAYSSWCEQRGKTAITLRNFAAELDRERGRPEMKNRVRKFGDRYYGIGLVTTGARAEFAGKARIDVRTR
jgi:hypothetical protein